MGGTSFEKIEVQIYSQKIDFQFFRNGSRPSAENTSLTKFAYFVRRTLSQPLRNVGRWVPWVLDNGAACGDGQDQLWKNRSPVVSQKFEIQIY